MPRPPLDVATFLAAQSLGLTLGVNLFPGTEDAPGPGVPTDAVYVYGMPGGRPDRNADTRIEHRYAIVHIRIRDTREQEADALARSIMTKMQGAIISGYLDVRSLQSEPGGSFERQSGLHRISLSYECVYESNVIP